MEQAKFNNRILLNQISWEVNLDIIINDPYHVYWIPQWSEEVHKVLENSNNMYTECISLDDSISHYFLISGIKIFFFLIILSWFCWIFVGFGPLFCGFRV